jgi:hypothetical protein
MIIKNYQPLAGDLKRELQIYKLKHGRIMKRNRLFQNHGRKQ